MIDDGVTNQKIWWKTTCAALFCWFSCVVLSGCVASLANQSDDATAAPFSSPSTSTTSVLKAVPQCQELREPQDRCAVHYGNLSLVLRAVVTNSQARLNSIVANNLKTDMAAAIFGRNYVIIVGCETGYLHCLGSTLARSVLKHISTLVDGSVRQH